MPFNKGLNKEIEPRLQPEGTYRHARNAVISSEDGELRRERGPKEILDLTGHEVRGSLTLGDSQAILFLSATSGSTDRIVEADLDAETTTILASDMDFSDGGLNFGTYVESVYRTLANGDRVIYWTDGENPPRYLNIDGQTPTTLQELRLFPNVKTRAEFTLNQLDNYGGQLEGGTYQLAFSYVDEDGSKTNYFLSSGAIHVNNRFGHGASVDEKTTRAIDFTLDNLDTTYDYVQVSVVKGSSVNSLDPFVIPDDGTLRYTYTGGEEGIDQPLDDILIDRETYKQAGTMAEQNGVLYMGNLSKPVEEDVQPYVNNWEMEAVTKPLSSQVDADKSPEQLFEDPDVAHAFKTYKRGEAYAFYATFLYEDGSESDAFHIPGRGSTGASDELAKASLTVDEAAPDPTDGAASGTVNIESSINSQGQAAGKEPILTIESEATADDAFDVVLYDNGTEQARISVSTTAGDSAQTVAQAVQGALNNNITFAQDWTANLIDEGNTVWSIGMNADQNGSAYNGWKVDIENDAGNFTYSNTTNTTDGGSDNTGDAPVEYINLIWDGGDQSVTVTVTTLNGLDDQATICSKFVTALNNNSTISGNFTATDNGDGTFGIEADQNGKTYNGNFTWSLNAQKSLSEAAIEGGWSTSNDVLSYTINWSPKRPDTDFTVDDGESAQAIADNLFTALDNNSNYSDLTFSQNGTTINATDNSKTANLNGDRPEIAGSPYPLTYSETIFEGGGSESNAESVVSFNDSFPDPQDKRATGTIYAPDVPSAAKKASAEQFGPTSGASASGSVDLQFVDDQGSVQATVTINYTQGETALTIANRMASTMERNFTFGANFRYNAESTSDGARIYMEALYTGSSWNGYDIRIDTQTNPDFNYNFGATATTGGQNATADAPDYYFEVDYGSGKSRSLITGLNGEDDASTSAGKMVTELNNSSEFSSLYTATDNGDGTITVEADSTGKEYNGQMTTGVDGSGNIAFEDFLDGGWDSSTDSISLTIAFLPGASVQVDINQGASASTVATKVHNKLVNTDPDGGTISYILEDNDTQIRGRELSGTSDPNGKIPSLYSDPTLALPITRSAWSGGGATNSKQEKKEISDNHPLAKYKSEFGTLYNFHHTSTTDESGLGYWENASETYPDKERWKVKDATGAVVGDLRGRKVRHHRMPEQGDSQHYDGSDVQVIGLKVKNADIPSDLKDRIKGYRIYYAKKDPNERLILDQGRGISGWLDSSDSRRPHQQVNEVFEEDVWSAHGFPAKANLEKGNGDLGEFNWKVDTSLLQFHSMETMRRKLNVANITHVKGVVNMGRPGVREVGEKASKHQTENAIRSVKSAGFVDHHERNISLTDIGFSHDYENPFGESKMVMELDLGSNYDSRIYDLCQLKQNLHRPFDNQELKWTGFTGTLDATTDGPFYGGDIFIGAHYFKANTLLALADKGAFKGGGNDSDYGWWGRNHSDGNLGRGSVNYLYDLYAHLFGLGMDKNGNGDGPDIKEVNDLRRALKEQIGNTSGINSLPIVWGTLWREVTESRDNPWWREDGEGEFEDFYPKEDQWIANVNFGDKPTRLLEENINRDNRGYRRGRWIFRFYAKSDNFYRYNDEYTKLSGLKPAFPHQPEELNATEYPTRIIRSAETEEGGERSLWREFRPRDLQDLPRDRGDLVRIVPLQSGLVLHTEDSLFRTRGRKRLQVGEETAYLGTGNIFKASPAEMQNLEAGFAGLSDPRHAARTPFGYIWVDAQAQKVYQLSDKMQEISRNGLRTYFQDHLDAQDNIAVGVHPNSERVFVDKDGGFTLSYNPVRKKWISFHDLSGHRYFNTRNRGFVERQEKIYAVGEGSYGNYYGSVEPFTLRFAQSDPKPESQIVVSAMVDATVLDNDGNEIESDIIDTLRVWNDHQDTGEIVIRPHVGPTGQRRNRPNARKTDRVWKINNLRDGIAQPTRRSGLERLADNTHLVEVSFGQSTDQRTIHMLNAFLIRRTSKR